MDYKTDIFSNYFVIFVFILTSKIFAERNQGSNECCKLGIYEGFKYLPNCKNDKCGEEFAQCCKETYNLRSCEEGTNHALKRYDCNIFSFDSIQKICCIGCMNALSTRCIDSLENVQYKNKTNILLSLSYRSCCFELMNENQSNQYRRYSKCSKNEDCSRMEICDNGICKCQKGFQYLDKKCVDIDECEKNPCPPSTSCYNTYGSYECLCNIGFILTDNGTCTDINECEITSVCLHGKCVNTVGSFRCEQEVDCPNGVINSENECICEKGMKYDNFLKICTDIDECLNDKTCDNDEICVDLINGYKCEKIECPVGYKQLKPGECVKTCENCTGSDLIRYRFRFISSAVKGISLFVIDLEDNEKIHENKLLILPPHSEKVAIVQSDGEGKNEHIILNEAGLGSTVLNMKFMSNWKPQGYEITRNIVQEFILKVYIGSQ